MQKNNSFNLNIYTMLFNALRLTILILLVFLCGSQFGCYKNADLSFVKDESSPNPPENAVNINTASFDELKKLPKIGDKLAHQIIEYREKYGKFRRAEHLILVHGMSDKKIREIKSLVKAE